MFAKSKMVNLLRVGFLGVVNIMAGSSQPSMAGKKRCALPTVIIKLTSYKITLTLEHSCFPLCLIEIFP